MSILKIDKIIFNWRISECIKDFIRKVVTMGLYHSKILIYVLFWSLLSLFLNRGFPLDIFMKIMTYRDCKVRSPL
jgi:hypothetical protein